MIFFFRRGFSLQEALELAYFNDINSIYVELLEGNMLTDKDSTDKDYKGAIESLSGRQLRAPVEVKFSNK